MRSLEKTVDLAGLNINVDVEVSGCGGQTGDGLDISSQSVEIACTSRHANVTDGDSKSSWCALEGRVVAE